MNMANPNQKSEASYFILPIHERFNRPIEFCWLVSYLLMLISQEEDFEVYLVHQKNTSTSSKNCINLPIYLVKLSLMTPGNFDRKSGTISKLYKFLE